MLVAIKADLAKRIQLCVSNEETRYYLNGFCVEPCLSGSGVNIVATDGHILGVFRDAEGVVENPANASWPIVQLDPPALKACAAKASHPVPLWLVVEGDCSKSTVSVVQAANYAEEAIAFHKSGKLDCVTYQANGKHFIDGTFPAWRRVVPSGELETGSAVSFNPLLLAKLGKCVQTNKDSVVLTISRSKDSPHEAPMLVNGGFGFEWFGILVPVSKGEAKGLPAWLNPPAPEAPAMYVVEAAE